MTDIYTTNVDMYVLAMGIILGLQIAYCLSIIWKMIIKKLHLRYCRRLYRQTRANYKAIPTDAFVMGKGLWNRECHNNAVQAVKEGTAAKVIMCMCMGGGSLFVHFVNVTDDGKYVDNTVGWRMRSMSIGLYERY